MLRPRFHAMRIATTHVSSRHRLTGGLLASATLAFIVAFAKLSRDTIPLQLPAVLDGSFSVRQPAASVPSALPPVVLKTCSWSDTHRRNLVIAVVGDTSEHTMWLEGSQNANWDLAVIYYGRRGPAFTCEQCMHIELGQGAKWQLVYQFTQSGAFAEQYINRYSQVYIPDDDIVQQSTDINKVFDVQEAYGLDLAQPTMCSQVEADTIHGMGMYKEAPTMLRYGTFVEIMVPLFSMDFFKRDVTNSLSTASSGHGLDWIWPYLLGYPQDKIAIIDEVCVIHPRQLLQRPGKVSMYDSNPTFSWQTEEEKAQFAKFGYAAQPLQERFGVAYLEKARLGQVWQPWYSDLLKQGGLMEQHATDAQGSGPAKGVKLVQPPFKLTAWQWPDTPSVPSQALARGIGLQAGPTDLLIVLVIYEGKQPRWLEESAGKPWNIIVIAPKGMDQITCPHCLFLHQFDPALKQGRYLLLYQLMQTHLWDALVAGKHKYLYFPQEGVVQDSSAISTLLQLSIEANLDLAHLTWCSTLDSDSQHMTYMQTTPTMILRHGTYVDTAAPIFSWQFLHQIVLPTLQDFQTGEGLGWLWPFMAGYPRDKIAVIDAACAMCPGCSATPASKTHSAEENSQWQHEQQQPPGVATKRMLDEELAQLLKFGYNPIDLGKPIRSKEVFSFIAQPWYQHLMAFGNFQAVTLHTWEMTAVRMEQILV